MKTRIFLALAAAILLGNVEFSRSVLTAGSLQAAEEKSEKKKKKMKDDSSTITGTVAVTKDAGGGVSAIKLTAADGTIYNITLDEAGKKLAESDGKSTSIHGTVAD